MPKTSIITFILLVLLFGPATKATILSPDEIAVRIVLPRQSICVDSKSLPLELYVANVGSREIAISPEWMLAAKESAVVFDLKERFARIDSMQTRSDSISEIDFGEGVPIVLPVGSAKQYETETALDKDFFRKPGFYKLRIHYKGAIRDQSGKFREVQIPSNWILFEVEACRPALAK